MRLVFVITSLGFGGAERVVINLANYLCSLNYSVCIVVLYNNAPLEYLLDARVSLVKLGSKRIGVGVLRCMVTLLRLKPHVVLVNLYPLTSLVFLLWRITLQSAYYVAVEHNNPVAGFLGKNRLKEFTAKRLTQWAYRRCELVCVSESLSKEVARYYCLRSKPVLTIYNPVITKEFRHRVYASRDWVSSEICLGESIKRHFINVASLTPQKNQSLLIKAVSVLKEEGMNVNLTLVGEGPDFEMLTQLVKDLHLESCVTFVGAVKDVLPYYLNADVFVLCSKYEGFGNVLVEALAVGLPIIAADCDFGPREILCNGEFGILIPPGDLERLVFAMKAERFPGSPDSRRERSEHFAVERAASQYERIWSSLD